MPPTYQPGRAMIDSRQIPPTCFHVEVIKPSLYDDQGYVVQWLKAWIPSNS